MRISNYKQCYQLTFFPHIFPINVYLIEYRDSLTLIDTGLKVFTKKIINLSKKMHKPITKILLTHPHNDHIGGLEYLLQETNAICYVSKRDYALMQGDFSLKPNELQDRIKGGFKQPIVINNLVLLNENDIIDDLKVINLPGHTPGSIGFYHASEKFIVVGDALQTQGGLAISGYKNLLFPFPAQATYAYKTAIESAEKLHKFDIDMIACGHGKLLYHPKEKLEAAIRKAQQDLIQKENKNA